MGFIQLVEPRFIQGLGLAFFFTPLIAMMLANMPAEKMASALGLGNFFRILGGSFGTSLSISVWNNRESFHQSHLVEHITVYNPLATQMIEQLQSQAISGIKSFTVLYATIINQAFMLATNDIFRLSAWVFIFLFVIIWFAKPAFVKSDKPIAVE